MEFWGVEVKSGQPLKVENELDKLLHLSHATLGETKANKGNESVPLFIKINEQKLVLGTLSEKSPQLNFDLVFEKEFELSHNWKNGSVFFMGYKNVIGEDYESGSESDEDDDIPLHLENGKSETKIEVGKPSTAKAAVKPGSSDKPKVKATEDAQKKDKSKEDDSDDDNFSSGDDDSHDDVDDDDDDVLMGREDDSSDDDDDDDEEDSSDDEEPDEDTPKKAEPSKKRVGESMSKTPVPAKKAKFSSPQKTDGKKSAHTATPHPSKQAAKPPADDKKNAQTPKSGTKVTCGSCSKTFNSEVGLLSHTKAKHGAK